MQAKFSTVLCVLGLILSLAGCSPKVTLPATVEPPSIKMGDPIPLPTQDVILTISGHINVTNAGDTLQLDMPTLERFGLVKYSVFDPYLQKDTVYTGVLMSDLGRILGMTEPSQVFHIVALDDYQVDLTLAQTQQWPLLLATRTDGEYMDVENSGPTRIIFPYDTHPELDPVQYNDLWIWNIEAMRID